MTTATTLRKYQDIIEGKLPPGLQAHIDAKSESKEEEVEESTEEEVEESRHFSLSQVNNAPILRKYQDILNEAESYNLSANTRNLTQAQQEYEDYMKRLKDDKALDAEIDRLGLGKSWYDFSDTFKPDEEVRRDKLQLVHDYHQKSIQSKTADNAGDAGEREGMAAAYGIDPDDSDWEQQLAAKQAEKYEKNRLRDIENAKRERNRQREKDEMYAGDQEAIDARNTPGSAAQQTALDAAEAQLQKTVASTSGLGNVSNMAGKNIDSYTGNKVNDNDDDLAYDYDLPKPKERRSAALRADAAEINAAGNTSSSPSTTTGPPHHQPFPGAPTKSVSRAEPKPVEKPVRTKPSLLSTDHDDIGTGWRKGPPVPVGPKRVPAQPASTQQSPPKVKIVPEPLEPPKPKPKLKQSKSKGRYDISTGSYSQT